MQGKIVKGVGGFYYVHEAACGIYACKARGIFRNENIRPLVGDMVDFEVTHEGDKEGNIIRIHPRKNLLVRPAVANVDQAVILFAVAQPAPHLNMLDRFLITMRRQQVETLICFNKTDAAKPDDARKLAAVYKDSGCRVLFTSAVRQQGIDELRVLLERKTTVLAGPSGVGKSTILNLLKPGAGMPTGEISKKIARGRHTTRHSELFHLQGETYVMDTPGFTSLYLEDIAPEDLKDYYPEFAPYVKACRFGNDCIHISEPDCAVKTALAQGQIAQKRYQNYLLLYEEQKDKRKY